MIFMSDIFYKVALFLIDIYIVIEYNLNELMEKDHFSSSFCRIVGICGGNDLTDVFIGTVCNFLK